LEDENLRLAKYLVKNGSSAPQRYSRAIQNRIERKDLEAAKYLISITPKEELQWLELLHAAVNSVDLALLEFMFTSGCPRDLLLEGWIIDAIALHPNIDVADMFLDAEATKHKKSGTPATITSNRSNLLGTSFYDPTRETNDTRSSSQYLLESVLIQGNESLMKYLIEERSIPLDETTIKRHLYSESAKEQLEYLLKHFPLGITLGIVEAAYRSGDESKINAVQPYIALNPSLLTLSTLSAIGFARSDTSEQYYALNSIWGEGQIPLKTEENMRKQLEHQLQAIRQLEQTLHVSLPAPTNQAVLEGIKKLRRLPTETKATLT